MLSCSKFCKDSLMAVKLPIHVVIEVQNKIIYCCIDWNQKLFCCLLIRNISLICSNLLLLTAIVMSELFHLIFKTRIFSVVFVIARTLRRSLSKLVPVFQKQYFAFTRICITWPAFGIRTLDEKVEIAEA